MAFRGLGSLRELIRRSLYGINAARRVATKVAGGQGVQDVLAKERKLFEAHKKAQKQRRLADEAIDKAKAQHGNLLGWYLGEAEQHCPVCIPLDGNNFYADRPPSVGKPSQVHIRCACFAGPPHPGGRILR